MHGQSSQTRISVVWFKRDLRLSDHAPMAGAAAAGVAVVPLFIAEPEYFALPDVSQRHWRFVHDSLTDLRTALADKGAPLVVRCGSAISVLSDLRRSLGAFDLFSHEETGNGWTYRRDLNVAAWCRANDVSWREYPSNGVVRKLVNRDGWSRLRDARMRLPLIEAPRSGLSKTDLEPGELPAKDDPLLGASFTGGVQQGGSSEGRRALNSFLNERSRKYMLTISKPGISARHCSRLSAHIAYGSLSVRQVEQAAKARLSSLAGNKDPDAVQFRRNILAFLSRLAWRCHFVQKLESQPEIETRCMHPAFEGMREPHHNDAFFEAWKNGRTGYPLVDASMRSLHANGWINFRMRAMLVSFASYHLWLDWRRTAPFLARLFTDYEPGIHYSQFQMQSGVTGINAIRMYSPVKQSLDHDPQGKFIRRYVPELAAVSTQWIHEPWRLPEPPSDYPSPLVDHETAIKRARAEISGRWKSEEFRETARGVAHKLGSRSKQPARKLAKPPKRQLELEL